MINSSGSCNEIVPPEDANQTSSSNNSNPISAIHNDNNEESKELTPALAVDPRKKSSLLDYLPYPFKFNHKNSEPNSTGSKTAAIASTTTATNIEPNTNGVDNKNGTDIRCHSEAEALANLISADLDFMRRSSDRIRKYDDHIREVSGKFDKLKEDGASADDLRELKKIVKKLKQHISSKNKDEADESESQRDLRSNLTANIKGSNAVNMLDKMPDLYKNPLLERSMDFKDFESSYSELDIELKLCLLCFSVFPENVEIKKRVMLYWWIGEGFARSIGERTAEQSASNLFNKLVAKGFIEPIYKKPSPGVDICKVHPFVRVMLIKLAKRANFFDFDDKGDSKEDYSLSLRACLTGKGLTNIQDLERLHTLFNVSVAILEFQHEWFAKMKNINVLYLGRWQTLATHHIEVEDTKSMKTKYVHALDGLENMKHLKFLSLQGISRITELPESILKLTSLTILDLRACHNLEVLPDGIGRLNNLTHLDISECYLLDQMPKGLASLSQLQVLSGFVVGDSEGKNSCTLQDLWKLSSLRKLSIHTGLIQFPSEDDLCALNQFKVLSKLTIAWGSASIQAEGGTNSASGGTPNLGNRENGTRKDTVARQAETAAIKPGLQRALTRSSTSKQGGVTPDREYRYGNLKKINLSKLAKEASKKSLLRRALTRSSSSTPAGPLPQLPSQLTKLDLQCFPDLITPIWLIPSKLRNLKKLYIRGGRFSDLGQIQDFNNEEVEIGAEKGKWEVEDLRLKYLTELEMDWRELQELFPKLNYLEKVKCPNLTFFPCDQTGVWMRKQ